MGGGYHRWHITEWDLFLQRILMILQFLFNLITFIWTISQSTDVQHITSLHQIAYVQRIRCINK
jgi:preprotein translocase subunit SecG